MQKDIERKFRSGSMNERAIFFFEEITDSDSSKTHRCLIEGCRRLVAGTNLNGLVSHLKSCHNDIFTKKILIGNQHKTPAYYARQRLLFIQNCVEIVTINARPFKYLDCGF